MCIQKFFPHLRSGVFALLDKERTELLDTAHVSGLFLGLQCQFRGKKTMFLWHGGFCSVDNIVHKLFAKW